MLLKGAPGIGLTRVRIFYLLAIKDDKLLIFYRCGKTKERFFRSFNGRNQQRRCCTDTLRVFRPGDDVLGTRKYIIYGVFFFFEKPVRV